MAIGGIGGGSNVELIAIQKDNANCDPMTLPYAISGHATVASGKGVITCGGTDGKERLSTCFIQNKTSNSSWFPSMQSQRSHFDMVILSNTIYAIGGHGSSQTMETIDIYNGSQWTQ